MYLGFGLPAESAATRHRYLPSFNLRMAGGPTVSIKRMSKVPKDTLVVFNGRYGLELPNKRRTGRAGMDSCTETCAMQSWIFELLRWFDPGDDTEAKCSYSLILPVLILAMNTLETP